MDTRTDFTRAIFSYDDLCAVAKRLRSKGGIEITDRRIFLHNTPKSFIASEAVKWMQYNLGFTTEQAIFFGQLMATRELIHHSLTRGLKFIDSPELWRFQIHEEGPLNWKHIWVWDIESKPCIIAARLYRNLLKLCANIIKSRYENVIDKNFGEFTLLTINYTQIFHELVNRPEFDDFEYSVAELQKVDLMSMDAKEKLSFWINVYNTLCLHSIITWVSKGEKPYDQFWFFTNIVLKSKFFTTSTYLIGDHIFSLDEIEHGILRPNNNCFKEGDPRLHFKLEQSDPRIFFALNCCTKSSPKSLIIKHQNVDKYMTYACKRYLESVKYQENTMQILLPKIMDWYSSDFGPTREDWIKFVINFLPPNQNRYLSQHISKFSVNYLPYDWDIFLDTEDFDIPSEDPRLKPVPV